MNGDMTANSDPGERRQASPASVTRGNLGAGAEARRGHGQLRLVLGSGGDVERLEPVGR
jgi:hypothetical protein